MLLMKLETKERFAFLELAHYVALIDGDYSLKEKNLILEFCAEMGIEDQTYGDHKFDLDNILNSFSSLKSKKVVVLALMILVHIDDNFDLYEYKLIQKISEHFGINELETNLFSQWGKSVTGLYTQARYFIED